MSFSIIQVTGGGVMQCMDIATSAHSGIAPGTIFAGSDTQGYKMTSNGGLTWQIINKGLQPGSRQYNSAAVLLSKLEVNAGVSALYSLTGYAANNGVVNGGGLIVCTNPAAAAPSWSLRTAAVQGSGEHAQPPLPSTGYPRSTGRLLAEATISGTHYLFAATYGNGVQRSATFGADNFPVTFKMSGSVPATGQYYCRCMFYDPASGNLYLGTYPTTGSNGGLWVCTNPGAGAPNFVPISPALPSGTQSQVEDVVVFDSSIYIVCDNNGVFSLPSGASAWRNLNGSFVDVSAGNSVWTSVDGYQSGASHVVAIACSNPKPASSGGTDQCAVKLTVPGHGTGAVTYANLADKTNVTATPVPGYGNAPFNTDSGSCLGMQGFMDPFLRFDPSDSTHRRIVSVGGMGMALSAGLLYGERNKTFDLLTAAGVTGMSTAIGYVGTPEAIANEGPVTGGVPDHWPTAMYHPDVKIQIFDYQPDPTTTINGTLDPNNTAFMTSAPAGSWIMPNHEPGVGPNNNTTGPQIIAIDRHLIALKNRVAPSLLYGRGMATLGGSVDTSVWIDSGQSFTATGTPCTFTSSPNFDAGITGAINPSPNPNGLSVILKGGSIPAGFTANTVYYVVNASGTTFKLSATIGGAAIGSGSGSGTVVPVPDFYGMDGYQHAPKTSATPATEFALTVSNILAANPAAKISIIETGTAVGTGTGQPPPTPLAGVTAWMQALAAYAQATPSIFSINTYFADPSDKTSGAGTQFWSNSFAPAVQALSNSLGASTQFTVANAGDGAFIGHSARADPNHAGHMVFADSDWGAWDVTDGQGLSGALTRDSPVLPSKVNPQTFTLAIDPSDSTIYAGSGAKYISTNTGGTISTRAWNNPGGWTAMTPAGAGGACPVGLCGYTNAGVKMLAAAIFGSGMWVWAASAVGTFTAGWNAPGPVGITICNSTTSSPPAGLEACIVKDTAGIIYCLDRQQGLFRSSDYGSTWTLIWAKPANSVTATIVLNPAVAHELWFSATDALYRIPGANIGSVGGSPALNPVQITAAAVANNGPVGADKNGNIYCATPDAGSGSTLVTAVSPGNIWTDVVGDSSFSECNFSPTNIDVGPDGHIYVGGSNIVAQGFAATGTTPASGAFTLVQVDSTVISGSAGTLGLYFASTSVASTANTLLVAFIEMDDGTQVVTGPSGWAMAVDVPADPTVTSGTSRLQVWYYPVNPGGLYGGGGTGTAAQDEASASILDEASASILAEGGSTGGVANFTYTNGSAAVKGNLAEFAAPAGMTQILDQTGGSSNVTATVSFPEVLAGAVDYSAELGVAAFTAQFPGAQSGQSWSSPSGWSSISLTPGTSAPFANYRDLALPVGTNKVTGTYSISTGMTSWAAAEASFYAITLVPVEITTLTLPSTPVSTPYSQTVVATGGLPSYSWSWAAAAGSSLPPGLSINSSTGVVSGTPTATGTYNVIVTVTDAALAFDTQALSISVTGSAGGVAFTQVQLSGNIGGSAGSLGLWFSNASDTWSTAGSLLIARIVADDGSMTVTPPSGWALATSVAASAATSGTARAFIYYRLNNPGHLYGNAVVPPSGLAAAAGSAGSSFTSGTYFWVVTGTSGTETTASNEATLTITAGTQVNLTWAALPAGTTAVKVYRGTSAGNENKLVATLGAVTSYTDTGSAGTSASPPATPASGVATFTYSNTSATVKGRVFEYASPAGSTQFFDQQGTASGLGTQTSLAVTATSANTAGGSSELGIALFGADFSVIPTSTPPLQWTQPTGWQADNTIGNALLDYMMSYKTNLSGTATTSVTGTFTATGGTQTAWVALVATFYATGGTQRQPPVIGTSSLPDGVNGLAYPSGVALIASGGTPAYSWSVISGALPAGLSLASSTGAITGTPSVTGLASFTVQVTDAASLTATQALTINVDAPVSIGTTSPLPNAPLGSAYNGVALVANNGVPEMVNGVPSYDWAITSGSLPPGILLDFDGTVTGQPGMFYGIPTTTTGSPFTFTVQVTDSYPETASASLQLSVVAGGLTITTLGLPPATVNVSYSATLHATGGTGTGYTWTVTSGALPAGFALNSSTGVISGLLSTPGTSPPFTVQVTDSGSNTDTQVLVLAVQPQVVPAMGAGAIAVAGIGALGLGPAPGTGLEYELYAYDFQDWTTLLCVIPKFTGLSFAKMVNDKGSGSVTLNLDDLAFWGQTLGNGQPASYLIDKENLFQVRFQGLPVFEFLGETVTEQLADASESRIVTISGPGTIQALTWARSMPLGFPNVIFKTDAITDSFDEVDDNGNPVLDTAKWNLSEPLSRISLVPAGATGSSSSGVNPNSTQFYLGTCYLQPNRDTVLLGAGTYDITSSVISAQVLPIAGPGLDGSQQSAMFVESVTNSNAYALMAVSIAGFYAQVGLSDGHTRTKIIGPYSATAHAYWQITEESGRFFFWFSADDQNWVAAWNSPYDWDATEVDVFFSATYDAAGQHMGVSALNSDVVVSSGGGNLYYNEPIMAIWLDLLELAQDRGTIPQVTTRMTKDADSWGGEWTDLESVQIANGTDLYSLLQGHCAMINADFMMEPGFVLKVGQPNSAPGSGGLGIGQDMSATVIIREAAQTTSKGRTRARDQIANLIGSINGDNTIVTAEDSDSVVSWGQREGWVQTGATVTEAANQTAAEASVNQTSGEVLGWTIQVLPFRKGATPFTDFQVGDWVGLEPPPS